MQCQSTPKVYIRSCLIKKAAPDPSRAAVSSWTACWSMCFNKARSAGWCVAKHLSGICLYHGSKGSCRGKWFPWRNVVCCWTMALSHIAPLIKRNFPVAAFFGYSACITGRHHLSNAERLDGGCVGDDAGLQFHVHLLRPLFGYTKVQEYCRCW